MSEPTRAAVSQARLGELARIGHTLITDLQHPSGAYPASPTFSAYAGYAWLRDGAFIAEGISRTGDVRSADRFHDWVTATLLARRGHLDELLAEAATGRVPQIQRMLPTRFTLAGDDGQDPWWDFQTDGYGTWLWALVAHAERHGRDPGRWRAGAQVAVDYLTAFWSLPCYDWWEEHHEHRHVSTLGAIYGGLTAVVRSGTLDPDRAHRAADAADQAQRLVLRDGVVDGHLTKWLGSGAVDGSLPACIVPFGLVEPGSVLAKATLDAVAADLDVDGGVHRFTADVFYGGGQWPLLSGFLGWNLAAAGDQDGARRLLQWMAAQATPQGHLPEQVDDHLLHPEHRTEWIDRWGSVATPLLWSHGMYLILADELGLTGETP